MVPRQIWKAKTDLIRHLRRYGILAYLVHPETKVTNIKFKS